MNSVLKITNLSRAYAGQLAIDGISLELAKADCLGLIGLNGAGKTTLIKCIMGLQRADSGEILINGLSSEKPVSRQELFYLPELFSAPDFMTGQQYLQFINNAYRQPKLEQLKLTEHIAQLAERLDFAVSRLSESVRHYSKGMTQKLGLMAAVLSAKPILILDEPLSGLDPKARALFVRLIKELQQAGKSIIICTHILEDVESVCNKVGILNLGKLEFLDSTSICCLTYNADNLQDAFLQAIAEQ